MTKQSLKNLALGLILTLSSQSLLAAGVKSTVDTIGIQVIEGELAFAIYIAIQDQEQPVRDISNSVVTSYTKEVDELSCTKLNSGTTCFVSKKSGSMPSDIAGTTVNKNLFDQLITRSLPLGVDINGNGNISGYVKKVSGIICSRSVKTGEFFCNINFRQ